MVKVFLPKFTIKPVYKPKVEHHNVGTNISRKCLAVVAEIDGEFKAIINIDKHHIILKEGDEPSNEQLVLPFTDKSLSLKGKTYVFKKDKDESNHYVCVIRDTYNANTHPGLKSQYNALHPNLLIAGHIIRKNGKMYFNYEDLISHHYLCETHLCNVRIDADKPLFNK